MSGGIGGVCVCGWVVINGGKRARERAATSAECLPYFHDSACSEQRAVRLCVA